MLFRIIIIQPASSWCGLLLGALLGAWRLEYNPINGARVIGGALEVWPWTLVLSCDILIEQLNKPRTLGPGGVGGPGLDGAARGLAELYGALQIRLESAQDVDSHGCLNASGLMEWAC